ncbi:condensation domain-containing protein [Gordonia aurantiaca]|uniref:condensation domain-containing protein n=1 Tax=Gordonia sp. B21 TaxID=3151852 RepID=UPI0032632729
MTVLTDARLTLLRRRLERAEAASTTPGRTESSTASPAAFGDLGVAERRMWKIYELDPKSLSHNIGLVLEFGGDRTVDSVVAAAELLVERFEILRSVIAVDTDGVPHRKAVTCRGRWNPAHSVWTWGFEPTPALSDGAADVDDAATELTRTPFDLYAETPLRLRVSGRDGGVAMVLVVHHLAVDDTSWPPLLGTLVSGAWPGDTGVDVRPADPDEPTAAAAAEAAVRHALDTWGAPGIRYPISGELPAESPTDSWSSPMDDRAGVKVSAPVADDSLTALQRTAQTVGATPNALLIAICSLATHALTGSTDHVLVVPADNRKRSQAPDRVGYCGNIIPMRFRVDPDATVAQALRDAGSVIYRAMEHSSTDFGPILTAIRQAGGRFPVMEIMASVRPAPLRGIPRPANAPVTCRSVFNGIANYPLSIAFETDDEATHVEVDHQPGVVPARVAERATAVLTGLVDLVPHSLDSTVSELVAGLESRGGR